MQLQAAIDNVKKPDVRISRLISKKRLTRDRAWYLLVEKTEKTSSLFPGNTVKISVLPTMLTHE
jgi:hypothetical protein